MSASSKLVCKCVSAQVDSEDGKSQVLIPIPKYLMRAYENREAETLMYYKNRAARHEEQIRDEIMPMIQALISEDDAVMLYGAQDIVNKFNTFKELLKDWIKEKKDRVVLETVLNTWIAEDQAQNTDDSGDNAGNQNQDTGDDNGDTEGTSGDTGQDAGDGTGDDTSGSGDGGDDPSNTGNDTGDGDGDTGDTQGDGNTNDTNDIDNP